jgi:hypothetical protein
MIAMRTPGALSDLHHNDNFCNFFKKSYVKNVTFKKVTTKGRFAPGVGQGVPAVTTKGHEAPGSGRVSLPLQQKGTKRQG